MTNYVFGAPTGDVIVGTVDHTEMETGTSTIKPGMVVSFSDDRTVTIGTSGDGHGIALYKETNGTYRKDAVGSTYDKGDWIAVALPPCNVYAYVDGTVSAGDRVIPSTTTAGYFTGTASAGTNKGCGYVLKARNGSGQTWVHWKGL